MRELWRKTWKLFVSYPILWLPYICAHLLNASVDLLRQTAVRHWLVTRQYTPATIARLSERMECIISYPKLCLDTAALVITAALVTLILRSEQPRLGVALKRVRENFDRVLGYSLKLYFLNLIFFVLVSLPALRLARWVANSTAALGWIRAANFALTQGQGLISLVLFAWIMTPVAIRMLRDRGAEAPSTVEKDLGRYSVMVAGATGFALSASIAPSLFRLITFRSFPRPICFSLISLILSFPFLLGEIALALIAFDKEGNWQAIPTRWKWPQFVQDFMPLHFEEHDKL